MLAGQERRWAANALATGEEIAQLLDELPFSPPEEYIELLRVCNGGEGELALHPLRFQLYDTKFAIELWKNEDYRPGFADLFFFGSNGGTESIAIDLKAWRIVMVDCMAGPDSAEEIASNMRDFIDAVGLPAGLQGSCNGGAALAVTATEPGRRARTAPHITDKPQQP